MEKFIKTLTAEQAIGEINLFREISEKNIKKGGFIEANLKIRINSNFVKINCGEEVKIVKGSDFIEINTINYRYNDVNKSYEPAERVCLSYKKDTFFEGCYERSVIFN